MSPDVRAAFKMIIEINRYGNPSNLAVTGAQLAYPRVYHARVSRTPGLVITFARTKLNAESRKVPKRSRLILFRVPVDTYDRYLEVIARDVIAYDLLLRVLFNIF